MADWTDADRYSKLAHDLGCELASARDELAAAAKFKAFVHSYLTQHGVPEGDPENPHQKEGCRIGARLDLLFAERDELRVVLQEMRDSFCEAAKLPGRTPSVKMLRDLAHYLRMCDRTDAVLAKARAARK